MSTPVTSLMAELSGCLHLDGECRPSRGDRASVIDPATELVTAEYALATMDEIDSAVASAGRAQREWWALSALERAGALHRVADRLVELAPAIGECMTREMGKPFRESN